MASCTTRSVLGGVLLLATACGQGPVANGVNAADGDAASNGAASGGVTASNNTQAKAGPHPVTMEPDPANQTGPVARSVDAGFPEPCQAYVRDIQSCIEALSGPEAVSRTRELRLQLHSNRGIWLSVQDRAGLTNICRDNVGILRAQRRDYHC